MAEQADIDLARLSRLRVLHLSETERAKRLQMRWRYYEQRQHDDAEVDFDSRPRQRGLSYTQQRARGFTTQANAMSPGGPKRISERRPSCPTTIAGEIVDTYTAALLGAGRHPTINVVGDPDSTALLGQMFAAANVWDAMLEARKFAGAQGCVALLPEINDGELCLRAMRAEDLYIEWTDSPGWIPRLVIEQKLVERDYLDPRSGEVSSSRVWQTRAWDQANVYIYKDLPEDAGAPDNEAGEETRIELAEAPRPHNAGRCPVIWLQNARDSDDPVGETDIPDGVYEQIDRLDTLWSMILRGTNANNDPTLVIQDKLIERRMWPMRAKGYGQKIELSEVGKASLLEMSGKTIETSWITASRLEEAIEHRTGVVIIRPDQAGAMQSGVALQILRGTMNNRVAIRRAPISRALRQLAEIFLTLARTEGIKEIGAVGRGIELAPIAVQPEERGGEMTFEMPRPGDGAAINISWPELHSPTPTDLQNLSQASTIATGGQAVVSQRTGVGLFAALGQTGVDPEAELERIEQERKDRVAGFERSMTPDADQELDDLIGDEGGLDIDEEGKLPIAAQDVQQTALNGAQIQAAVALLAQTGVTLAPEVVVRLQGRAFQIPEDVARANVEDQVAFLAKRPEPEAETAQKAEPPGTSP